jgi:DNA-binding NtrC family response regulator
MHKLARYYGLPAREFTPSVLEACVNHSWPGNLQELETFVKRYLLAGDEVADLGGFEINPKTPSNGSSQHFGMSASSQEELEDTADTTPESLKALIQSVKSEAERNAIVAALEKTAWNRKAAARLLRVSYRTLLYKIEQYHLNGSGKHVFDPGNSRSHTGEKKTG